MISLAGDAVSGQVEAGEPLEHAHNRVPRERARQITAGKRRHLQKHAVPGTSFRVSAL